MTVARMMRSLLAEGDAAFEKMCGVERFDLVGIELRNPPFPIGMQLELMRDMLALVITVTLPERNTGQMINVFHRHELPHDVRLATTKMPGVASPALVDFVFDRLRVVFEHELRECFHVHGVRVRDPHAAERTP